MTHERIDTENSPYHWICSCGADGGVRQDGPMLLDFTQHVHNTHYIGKMGAARAIADAISVRFSENDMDVTDEDGLFVLEYLLERQGARA